MATFFDLQAFYRLVNPSSERITTEVGHFTIFRIEDVFTPGHKPVTYSRRNYFKVSLVTGHSKIHYADRCIDVPQSALVFTNPMIPYFWERIGEHHSGFVVVFTEDFFGKAGHLNDYPVFQAADAAVVPLDEPDMLQFRERFLRMEAELQGSYRYKYDLLRNLLLELVHSAQKMQPALGRALVGSNASERITALFAELLERQFPIELSNQILQLNAPSAFANQLTIHVNHLNKILKETTGQTTTQLINERIAREAKILLKSTNWTINEIAWSLGFKEPNHFSSFFKKWAKVSPTDFRQRMID